MSASTAEEFLLALIRVELQIPSLNQEHWEQSIEELFFSLA